MNEDIFLVNEKRSVLFCLNFQLAKMWKDRLEDEEDNKNISMPSFRRYNRGDITFLEEKLITSVGCV